MREKRDAREQIGQVATARGKKGELVSARGKKVVPWAEAAARLASGHATLGALLPVLAETPAAETGRRRRQLGELRPNVVDATTHRNAMAFAAHRCAR